MRTSFRSSHLDLFSEIAQLFWKKSDTDKIFEKHLQRCHRKWVSNIWFSKFLLTFTEKCVFSHSFALCFLTNYSRWLLSESKKRTCLLYESLRFYSWKSYRRSLMTLNILNMVIWYFFSVTIFTLLATFFTFKVLQNYIFLHFIKSNLSW